ncbi:hypothetical protein OV079_10510 [Nannocystis pusilla]|uniref:Uncharacterized protein n=1 Tax=Nannocystis pusilla TaxID=889268 RepID=A0A9X3EUW6_9BACT|nr:hypothetical protein [Nannocystis pusilla]MCY1005988.1 hypothetical protein [Nannocystis pusilla]
MEAACMKGHVLKDMFLRAASWRPRPLTMALTATAIASAALLRFDPWAGGPAAPTIYSAQSAARRVFPELGESELARATITLAQAGQPPVTLTPADNGQHAVIVGEAPLGPADAEGLAGLWSSLRMATTLRAVAEDSALGPVRGEIAVEVDGRRAALTLHGAASDGVGDYGTIAGAGSWVVEPELAAALAQPASAWLSRRLVPIEASEAAAVRVGPLELARGADSLWRVVTGASPQILAEPAVALRLDRIVAAEFEPAPAEAAELPVSPWLEVQDRSGRRWEVRLGPPCPGQPGRVVVDRGAGTRGCVEAEIDAPWPIDDPDGGLVEPQLAPYAYGRVLAVQMEAPERRRLRRLGGGWVVEEDGALHEVAEPEVFRWWTTLQQAPVELPARPLTGFLPEVDLTIESDSSQRLRLRCGPAEGVPLACRRDEAPPLVVAREEPLALAFTRETFAERRLLSFGTGEVRELEILPGRGSDAVRQSVRLDLGVWRLDAPVHPDGAAALDEVRLEAMLAGLQAARAEVWTDRPLTAPLRTIRVERTGSEAATLELHPDCVAHVPGQPRAALLPKSTCSALSDDLLYSDPLRFWLGQARRVELSSGTGSATATREGVEEATWSTSGDPTLLAGLPGWESFRAVRLVQGEPRGEPTTAKILRPGAATVTIEVGPTIEETPAWVRLRGADWYYAAEAAERR